jgi:hypothetical protein
MLRMCVCCILASSRITRPRSWRTDLSFLRWFCHKQQTVFPHTGAYGGALTMIKHILDPIIHKSVSSSARPSHSPSASSHHRCRLPCQPNTRASFQLCPRPGMQLQAHPREGRPYELLWQHPCKQKLARRHFPGPSSRSLAMSVATRAKCYTKKAEEGGCQGAQKGPEKLR